MDLPKASAWFGLAFLQLRNVTVNCPEVHPMAQLTQNYNSKQNLTARPMKQKALFIQQTEKENKIIPSKGGGKLKMHFCHP